MQVSERLEVRFLPGSFVWLRSSMVERSPPERRHFFCTGRRRASFFFFLYFIYYFVFLWWFFFFLSLFWNTTFLFFFYWLLFSFFFFSSAFKNHVLPDRMHFGGPKTKTKQKNALPFHIAYGENDNTYHFFYNKTKKQTNKRESDSYCWSLFILIGLDFDSFFFFFFFLFFRTFFFPFWSKKSSNLFEIGFCPKYRAKSTRYARDRCSEGSIL